MNWHKQAYFFVGMFCFFIQMGIRSWADQFQWVEPSTMQRMVEPDVEPVVMRGEELPEFLDTPIDQIFMFAYRYDTDTWEAIPFQIDEVEGTGANRNYFSDRDGIFDSDDELVFMVKDLGAKVPDGYWIDDPESRLFPRYELEVIDGIDSTKRAWGYLFKSSSSIPKSPLDYVDSVSDEEIQSLFYRVSFCPNRGIPIHFIITDEGGGDSNTEILDRLKFRVKIEVKTVLGTQTYSLHENDNVSVKEAPWIVDGPVRVFRNAFLQFHKTIAGQTFTGDFPLPILFYPYSMNIGADNINLDIASDFSGVSVKLKLIRYSFDFNTFAIGMRFINPYNLDRNIVVDGVYESMNHTVDAPGWNWFLLTGSPGSVLMVNYVPKLGSEQWLYYFDKKDGGAWYKDDTPNVPNDASYGDSGILFKGDDIKGTFSFVTNTYFLPANQTAAIGDSITRFLEYPVKVHPQIQFFDTTPPATIADLSVDNVTDSTMLVFWHAVGDDSTQGRAAKYELRYSKIFPMPSFIDLWWDYATPVPNTPEPQESGSLQSVVIDNLKPNTNYYLVIKVRDEANNQSEYSNVAMAATLDVELITFYAQVFERYVVLHWSTASETNNFGFEIQRRTEDEDYQTIGFVKGNGTTTEVCHYRYVDENLAASKYYYRLKQIDTNGQVHFYREIVVQTRLPQTFVLYQNYPNPFSIAGAHRANWRGKGTTIEFYLPEAVNVRVTIFNLLGHKVSTLVDKPMPAGFHKCRWDGRDWQLREVPAGVYFYRIQAGSWTAIRKLLVLR
ncbi:hypothetical protein DRQ11_05785 [candidate division KSB1 bacterium]|nr:MAG: hypothetical protein DRQ11_05785 [candidate division KSB1 bacterium]